jgi:hypothetical protein
MDSAASASDGLTSSRSELELPPEIGFIDIPFRPSWNIEGFATGWQAQIGRDVKIESDSVPS